ncbi:phospholipid scramblase 2-like [Teleopsis dalmanni]|uniref:phospholipid scramblase 2-like n=1 Tax=Teleopsis dalmanni TaxID=139649 RepID=UPI0018CD10BC|nr:phospholipid scramblase 2-like [Teleopsis dalmanni]
MPHDNDPCFEGSELKGYKRQNVPITAQPGLVQTPPEWVIASPNIPTCPPGLEYLTTVDQLLINKKVENFICFKTNNKYVVNNAIGQKAYNVLEDTDCCTRNCSGPSRPFNMRIFDNFQKEVIHLYRPLACSACCFPCCLQSIEISAPSGQVIGRVEQEWMLFAPSFRIKDANDETVLRIEGPYGAQSCCNDVNFNVVSLDGDVIGKISKKWSGFIRELFTDANCFGINFPMDLDVCIKAVLLGATFLIVI